MFLNLLIIVFLWTSLFEGRRALFGYSETEMFTYILLSSLIANFVLASRTANIAQEIVDGSIMNYILKPISFFKYTLTRDLADKVLNIIFGIVETAIVIILFKKNIVVQTDVFVYIVFFMFFFFGLCISFFVNLMLSFIGFWTVEFWAPRFIFFILVFFLSGMYFPLDILPKPLYFAFLLTPFPYLYYLPTKIYLHGFSQPILFESTMCVAWLLITYKLTKYMWAKGMKSYAFFGR